ncbi:hypothetical protein J1605_015195 [Eschrichtius robustus]|uniref:Uncharacterized protein n=1 Tax=Eschrichtius robustus TaxID=9764 RepID=A0AB34G9Z2_ESCRO|nr:hypothetical protein J1605_015195 [Eschrichtius robustus]
MALACATLALLEIMPPSCVPIHPRAPQHPGFMVGVGQKDSYLEDRTQSRHSVRILKYLVEQGIITDQDDVGKIWHHHTFYKENVSLIGAGASTLQLGAWDTHSPQWVTGRDGRWNNVGFHPLIPGPMEPSYWGHGTQSSLI